MVWFPLKYLDFFKGTLYVAVAFSIYSDISFIKTYLKEATWNHQHFLLICITTTLIRFWSLWYMKGWLVLLILLFIFYFIDYRNCLMSIQSFWYIIGGDWIYQEYKSKKYHLCFYCWGITCVEIRKAEANNAIQV